MAKESNGLITGLRSNTSSGGNDLILSNTAVNHVARSIRVLHDILNHKMNER